MQSALVPILATMWQYVLLLQIWPPDGTTCISCKLDMHWTCIVHAMTVAYQRKLQGAGELCRQQGIAFLPLVAESLGGWHPKAEAEIKKLGAALARHTGQDEGECISHLFSRCALLLQRGLAALLLNRLPSHPPPEVDGVT